MSTPSKGSPKSIWNIIQRANELSRRGTGVAMGKCLVEALMEVDPVTARCLVHTDKDPALDESNIDRFLAHLAFRFNLLT